jgi:drug/metabolite transporter (DMT)-like permease
MEGDLLILAACLCWALYTVGLRKIGADISPLRVTALTTYAGTPGLLILAWPQLRAAPWTDLSAGTWFGLLYSGVLGIGVAYVLWSYAVRGIGGSRTAVYNSLIPLVAGVVAWLVLGERPGSGQLAGAALVITGLVVSQRDRTPLSPRVAPAAATVAELSE